MLARLLAYGQAALKWDEPLARIRDRRKYARIPASVVVRSIMVMCLCRLGSLNSLGHTTGSGFWRRWLGCQLPSPDTLGRVADLVVLEDLHGLMHHIYTLQKRKKALQPAAHGLIAAVVDGHEMHAGYKRHCPGCLERTIHTPNGDRTQYYHRLVAVSLITRDLRFLLDAEPIARGEDEVAAALRLLERVIADYPRAFDVIQGDALYADPRFFNWAIAHGKDALAVLKDDRRDLLQDAHSLFETMTPASGSDGSVHWQRWDLEDFTTWPQVNAPVRVVACRETRDPCRRGDGQAQTQASQWYWVTTLSRHRASTGAVVRMGHDRWCIENEGFNELVNQYHADHVYRHEPTAIMVFWLLTQLALNVFTAFFRRNLKPAVRKAVSMLHVARLVLAELYRPPARAPT